MLDVLISCFFVSICSKYGSNIYKYLTGDVSGKTWDSISGDGFTNNVYNYFRT